LLWCLTFGTLSLLLFFIIFYNNVNFNISKLLYVKSNLSKPNLIGTSLGIQNRQVFNLYKLNKRFSTLWFFYSLVYTCQSPLMLWVRISIRARYTTLCYKVCQWFSPGPQVSSTNKTDHHDIIEILLKVALNTIKQTNNGHCQQGVDHHSLLLDR
jgi:hypothetical protein